ncbi:peptidase U32 family protein [Desulfurivibrio alkaliphilus]|uniref:Peptidase U32 n=1 Tax=Desulfurivibrio alkaliphilus (strain DSM 19089 / UNIQEM U267 / AHT2) TaxID=589865 RepID=D6Z4W7_DESAT|nr:U32 family peptidase [Desulfurivibrio alkaliphilus]ADH86592.1 peptidase U32 [Desulfurivibrio alkaliphilus AHT 2]
MPPANDPAQSPLPNRWPELLAPAGNLEKLQVAIHYGADAVYLGGSRFGLRAHAGNFSDEELRTATALAHEHGVRVYVTVNIFAHQQDFAGLPEYLVFLRELGVDGLIIADPGILAVARRTVPELPVHLSTQANVTNPESAAFWEACGVSRINPARELSLAEIKGLRQRVRAELEIFVHGALCISYSGRCFLSLYLTGRDANRGDCAHPCRYRYRLLEEKRPGQFFPLEEDERGSYIFNAKDLCLLNRLPELIRTGADALKIEGRMKSLFYVGTVVRLYRAALDFWQQQGLDTPLPPAFAEELSKIGGRGQSENFFEQQPEATEMLYDGTTANPRGVPAAIVRKGGPAPLVEARNPFQCGDTIEFLERGLNNIPCRVTAIHDLEGQALARANPNSLLRLTLDRPGNYSRHGLFRRVSDHGAPRDRLPLGRSSHRGFP